MKIFSVDLNHPIVSNHRFLALKRLVVWQVRSRIFRKDHIYAWVEKSKFYVKNGETGLTQNIYVGLQEFNEMGFMLHFLRKEDLFIDIGANSGAYSILATSVVGATTIAVEPVLTSHKRLIANFELNGLASENIAMNVGLGSRPGTAIMTSSLDTRNQIVLNQIDQPSLAVEITTLDHISKGLSPTLIKMDVEGWESEVIAGGMDTLRNPNLMAIIIELNGSGKKFGFDESEIIRTLQACGFREHSYDPLTRVLSRISGKNSQGSNTIFVKDKAIVDLRLSSSLVREVYGTSF